MKHVGLAVDDKVKTTRDSDPYESFRYIFAPCLEGYQEHCRYYFKKERKKNARRSCRRR